MGAADAPDAVALAWLPVVGAVTGGIAGLAAWGTGLAASHVFATAVAFVASIVLTGAMHVDGFLDGCDAFFASVSPERRLEILRDPRHGTFAVTGMTVLAVCWLAALWTLDGPAYPAALALAGASARWGAAVHALRIPYGRGGEPSRAFETRPPLAVLALGLLLCGALALPLGIRGAAALGAALLVAWAAVAWTARRLGGGLTGDAYGFSIAVAEVAALVALTV